jgi:hypothetical protein
LLRKLHVTGWPYIEDEKLIKNSSKKKKKLIKKIIKKFPLLEQLVMSSGSFQEELLLALVDHCPRLELLDVTHSRPTFAIGHRRIATRINSWTIKDFREPFIHLE